MMSQNKKQGLELEEEKIDNENIIGEMLHWKWELYFKILRQTLSAFKPQ